MHSLLQSFIWLRTVSPQSPIHVFHCLAFHYENVFFNNNEKIFSLHLPCCYLWLLPLIFLLQNCEKILFPHKPFWVPEVVIRCSLNLLFSRPDKQIPQCLCVYLMFQFPHGISGPWLHCLQLANLSLELWNLNLSTVSQKPPHKCRAEGNNPLPHTSTLHPASGRPGRGCPPLLEGCSAEPGMSQTVHLHCHSLSDAPLNSNNLPLLPPFSFYILQGLVLKGSGLLEQSSLQS